jgi:hypothetical protein
MQKDTNTVEIINSIMSLISIKDKIKGIITLENGDYQIETGIGYFPSFPKIKTACEFRGLKVFDGPVDGIKYVVVPNNVYKKYLFRRKLMRLKKDFYDE